MSFDKNVVKKICGFIYNEINNEYKKDEQKFRVLNVCYSESTRIYRVVVTVRSWTGDGEVPISSPPFAFDETGELIKDDKIWYGGSDYKDTEPIGDLEGYIPDEDLIVARFFQKHRMKGRS